MTKRRDTPPPRTSAGEKETLLGFLDYLRTSVAVKPEGATEPQVRTAAVPSGTNLLGLVKHLAHVERFVFLGQEPPAGPPRSARPRTRAWPTSSPTTGRRSPRPTKPWRPQPTSRPRSGRTARRCAGR